MPIKAKPLPSFEVLKEHFNYDPETGVITRITGRYAGPIERREPNGYIIVGFRNAQLKGHRVAWKLHTGNEPPEEIDHVNRNRSDNRWANLRGCTSRENRLNSSYKKAGKLPPGVQREKGRFYVQHRYGVKGGFATAEEAHQAYVQAHLAANGRFSVYARAKPSASASLDLRSA